MKYALIGCGRIAKNHMQAAIANNLDIAALCDINPKHAEKYAAENKLGCKIYTDYKLMLAEMKPDFAAIATESGKHAEIALACIHAGVHVLIEKPIALSVQDADKIIFEAETHNVIAGVCHQNRFNKAVQKLRLALDTNRFGRIYSISAAIRWNRNQNYYSQAPWRGTWSQDGGCLMNQCIHNIDLLRWLGGEVASVYGITNNFCHPYIEAEDYGTAIVRFKNGTVGTIEGTVNVYPKNLEETLTVFGEYGTAKLGGHSVNTILEWDFADKKDDLQSVRKEHSENPPDVYGFGHIPLYADFIQALNEKRKPRILAADGKNAMELVLAIYKASQEKAEISLPLEECATLDFM